MEGAGGISGLLARSSGYSSGNWTTHNYYFADGNGNVTYMLNSGQTMVASYRYDPFGNTISSGGTLASANVYRFSSKEIHGNSGMYYYGYRFYDPNNQRWINQDPLQETGGINLYDFVANDPNGIIDSWGLAPMSCGDVGDLIAQNNQSGLDDEIIKCVAFRESNFDPAAKNKKSSATGLLQMTDGACTDAGCDHSKMTDPAEAIRCGSKYIGIRVKRAKGNVTKGLDGFGTGPGYGKAIQDCAKCLKENKSGKDANGNPANNPCDKNCLKKAKG
jgi:RHS repeat-associated protein